MADPTARDLELLRFAAEHRLILAAHVQVLLDVSPSAAAARLRRLTAAGYLTRRPLFPAYWQLARKGFAVLGRAPRRPGIDLATYDHDVGLAWVWLAARTGRFGPLREVISERELRAGDVALARGESDPLREPSGVRLGGYGPGGRPRLHYPDLLLVLPGGQRVAVELELSAKGRARREKILSGYAVDSRIDAVLYLVERPSIARAVEASARQAGIADLVHVQPFRWGKASGRAPAPARVREREHGLAR